MLYNIKPPSVRVIKSALLKVVDFILFDSLQIVYCKIQLPRHKHWGKAFAQNSEMQKRAFHSCTVSKVNRFKCCWEGGVSYRNRVFCQYDYSHTAHLLGIRATPSTKRSSCAPAMSHCLSLKCYSSHQHRRSAQTHAHTHTHTHTLAHPRTQTHARTACPVKRLVLHQDQS